MCYDRHRREISGKRKRRGSYGKQLCGIHRPGGTAQHQSRSAERPLQYLRLSMKKWRVGIDTPFCSFWGALQGPAFPTTRPYGRTDLPICRGGSSTLPSRSVRTVQLVPRRIPGSHGSRKGGSVTRPYRKKAHT